MNTHGHKITEVAPHSIAEELGVVAGDTLLQINDSPIIDIFDYQYLIAEEELIVLIRKVDGEEWELEIEKDEEEDLGLSFSSSLMDKYRSCKNNCIFCFIDQMPKGMRDTLYFKDDDTRLSFLQGNYVTLTNLSDEDIDRIVRYHMSPINISFHTTNPELRCKMLHNRFAGDALQKVDRLVAEGSNIELNGQIVLCKGINDGAELTRTISDLTRYLPNLRSVSVVPVGITKFRDGLYPLKPFTKEDAETVLTEIHAWQDRLYKEHGLHFVHASDEFYLVAEKPLPEEETYDGYLQLENGVGMMRLFLNEFHAAFDALKKEEEENDNSENLKYRKEEIAIATGALAYPFIKDLMEEVSLYAPEFTIHVYEIRNDFFGEHITVTGLLTGKDIIAQCKDVPLGSRLLLPANVLRSGEDVLLDDVRVSDMEKVLQVPVQIIGTSGEETLKALVNHTSSVPFVNPYELSD